MKFKFLCNSKTISSSILASCIKTIGLCPMPACSLHSTQHSYKYFAFERKRNSKPNSYFLKHVREFANVRFFFIYL